MKFRLQRARIQQLIQHRNGYLVLASGSLLLNGLLALAIFMVLGQSRIVVVPPIVDKAFWVTATKASPDYLSQMALFFVGLRLNMTPSNAAIQREWLLRYVVPQKYNGLKSALVLEEESLKKGHMTTVFFPMDIKVDAKHLLAKVTGDKQTTLGDMHLPTEHLTYQIAFAFSNGQLKIKSFALVNKP